MKPTKLLCRLGGRVRALREASGLDVANAAKAAGVHRAVWHAVEETPRPRVTADTLVRIGWLFGTSAEFLLYGSPWFPAFVEPPDGGPVDLDDRDARPRIVAAVCANVKKAQENPLPELSFRAAKAA